MPAYSPSFIAAWSQAFKPQTFVSERQDPAAPASLFCAECTEEAFFVSATQRVHAANSFRRTSTGATWQLAPGSVYLGIALKTVNSLAPDATLATLLNRTVRPLLRALGPYAMYGGRDFVSLRVADGAQNLAARTHRAPVAGLAFFHDAATGCALVEAVIGTETPFEEAGRASFRGATPIAYREHSATALVERIVAAYGLFNQASSWDSVAEDAPLQSGFETTLASEIGVVGATWEGASRVIGGDFQASSDLLRAFSRDPSPATLERFAEGALFGLPDPTVLLRVAEQLKPRS